MKHTLNWYLKKKVKRLRILQERKVARAPKKRRKRRKTRDVVISNPVFPPILKPQPKARRLKTRDLFNRH